MHTTYTPRPNFHPFRSMMNRVTPSPPPFLKSTLNDPKWPWHDDEQIFSCANFSERCTKNDPKWPCMTCSWWKIPTYICYIHTWGPHFRMLYTVRWAFFNYGPIFGKGARINDPKWHWHVQGKKYQPACYIYPPRPKVSSFSFYDEQFFSYSPIFGKGHWMTPNGLDMFKVRNTNMHDAYTPGPNFRVFRSMMSRFWVTAQFSERCTEWPQMTLTCSR